MLKFDREFFGRQFVAFLAGHRLNGAQFAELAGIPQSTVSRITTGMLITLGDHHHTICKYMQIDAESFLVPVSETIARAVNKACGIDMTRSRAVARIVADVAALLDKQPQRKGSSGLRRKR